MGPIKCKTFENVSCGVEIGESATLASILKSCNKASTRFKRLQLLYNRQYTGHVYRFELSTRLLFRVHSEAYQMQQVRDEDWSCMSTNHPRAFVILHMTLACQIFVLEGMIRTMILYRQTIRFLGYNAKLRLSLISSQG